MLLSACFVFAQDEPTPEEQAEMAQKAMELAMPGPEHQKLAELAGNWDYKIKFWMSPDATEPMLAEGKAEAKMIVGGRFLQLIDSSMFMGTQFEGMNLIGFDRRSNEYTSVSFDNTGTYWVSAKGPADKETGLITLSGEDYDALTKMTQKYRFEMDIKDKDHFTFDVIFTDPVMSQGTGIFKMVELEYTRSK